MAPHLYVLAHHLIQVKYLSATLLIAPGDVSIGIEASCVGAGGRGARSLAMARYKQYSDFMR
jgi:hypothetical protein